MYTFDFHYEDGTNALFEHITSARVPGSDGLRTLKGGDLLTSYYDIRHDITIYSESSAYWVSTKGLRYMDIKKEA